MQEWMGRWDIGYADVCGATARVMCCGSVADLDDLLEGLECRYLDAHMTSLKESAYPFLYALDSFPRLLRRQINTAMLKDVLIDGCEYLNSRLCMSELRIGQKRQNGIGSVYRQCSPAFCADCQTTECQIEHVRDPFLESWLGPCNESDQCGKENGQIGRLCLE